MRLFLRSRKLPGYRNRLKERLGYYPFKLDKCLWVHAVSVGEVLAAIPLIKSLQQQNPHLPLLITNMTPTGAERVKAAFGDTVHQAYLPYDMPAAVKRFLNTMNPKMCVIMETEMWPNLLAACRQRNIPVVLTNGRLSAKSAGGYALTGSIAREMFSNVTHISACSVADADRYATFGAVPPRLTITGNLKFDLVLSDELVQKAATLRQQLGEKRFVWVAASTHDGEEGILLQAHKLLLEQNPAALLILVPRHPERFNTVAEMSARLFKTVRRSSQEAVTADTTVYLGDTMGELMLMYGAADVALVAGSFIPRGGHNILEPAVLAKPIITGIHVFNFADICHTFEKAQAMVKVPNLDELVKVLIGLMQDPDARKELGGRARAVMDANRGALRRQLDAIQKLMPVE